MVVAVLRWAVRAFEPIVFDAALNGGLWRRMTNARGLGLILREIPPACSVLGDAADFHLGESAFGGDHIESAHLNFSRCGAPGGGGVEGHEFNISTFRATVKHNPRLIQVFFCGTVRAMTDQWKIIDELAADLGVDENTRRVWRQRHVPHRWRLPILRLAEKRGIALSEKAFDCRYAEAR